MKILTRNWFIIAFTAGICSVSFAQTNDGNERHLQGKWILENISTFDENMKEMSFDMDSLSYEIPIEMDIQQDVIVFVRRDGTDEAKYDAVVMGRVLYFPIYAEWKIVENNLQLHWTRDIDSGVHNLLNIVLTYKLK